MSDITESSLITTLRESMKTRLPHWYSHEVQHYIPDVFFWLFWWCWQWFYFQFLICTQIPLNKLFLSVTRRNVLIQYMRLKIWRCMKAKTGCLHLWTCLSSYTTKTSKHKMWSNQPLFACYILFAFEQTRCTCNTLLVCNIKTVISDSLLMKNKVVML